LTFALQPGLSSGVNPEPQLPAQYVRAIFATKAIGILLILAVYWFVQVFVSPFRDAILISVAVAAALIPTLLVLMYPGATPHGLLRSSLLVDTVALTVGVHFGGGVDNVSVPLLYTAVIGLAGLLLTRTDTVAVAILSSLLYDAMVFAEYAGILPHRVPYSRPPDRQLGTVIPLNLYLLLFAWIVSFTVGRIREMYARLERMRQEAVQALSHDLKSPLSIIYGYAQLIESAEGEDSRRFGSAIERSAQQALDLVSNVLDTAAFEGRAIKPVLSPVSLKQLAEEVIDRYQPAAESVEVRVTTELPHSLPVIEADRHLLSRALSNLLSNAIKYGGKGGTVSVSAAAKENSVEISVRDSGSGIPADEQPLLFQKHGRTSSSHGVEGSGLGLYIVRRIAEAHGGSVKVESAPGAGATFTLSLPLLRAGEARPILATVMGEAQGVR
jgi:signal transduction histidine kinase